MAEVVLDRVRKVYPGNVEAVREVSLRIGDGEFVVLVGASGCGKSTTLRMVAGLEDITGGTISIGDRIVNDVHPKDRDIAMVFQNYALYPHMSVYKNMAFALQLRKIPKAEIDRRVREAAEILGITPFLDRKPKALSGGQRQRVAVGRCIVREPKAFLFDEPLSNLDAKLRVTTRAELKALHMRLKTTTIYVTHDQEEAMTLGDRVVIMANGIIQQAASPFDVYQRPANRFVGSFIGTPPMNLLEGTIEVISGVPHFVEKTRSEKAAQRLRAHKSHFGALTPYNGREVTLGLRPQSFKQAAFGEALNQAIGDDAALRLFVRVVEPLGEDMDVTCHTDHHNLILRIGAHQHLAVNEVTTVAVDMARAHYFEPGEFGANIVHRPGVVTAGEPAAQGAS